MDPDPGSDPTVSGTRYATPGQGESTESPLAEVTWLNETHVQFVFADMVVSESFGVAGDLFAHDIYDHFADGGHVRFPSGEVVAAAP